MKLFIILAAVALANAAKLDKTYLPPSNSQTSGGSGSFLQTPLGGQEGQANGFARNGDGFGQYNSFAQGGNGFSQGGNGFAQGGNGFAQGGNDYSENNNGFGQNQEAANEYNGNFNNFAPERTERPQAAFERNAAILRQDNQNDGETFSYAFETENGIYAEENGVATNGVEAQGGYSYTGDDGQVYSIRYTADQNGFVPQGDHLPTPPPVPEEILKALEQNARDEAAGIYDDGSYSEGKYSDSEDQYNGNNNYNNVNNYNNANNEAYNNQNFDGDDDSVVTTNALFRQPNGFNQDANSNQGFGGNQGINRNANQGFGPNQATSQAYLPPVAGQAAQRGSNQGFNGGSSNQGFNGGSSIQGFNGGSSNQGFNGEAFNQGSLTQANKAYLPPQRSSGPGFGSRTRQPSFSARNGYRY